ncbi:hypothetical protein BDR07DRAFT_1500791 [Suillus spraguei]|nr:hypothetical protein BDR07DRAFT_1500791 [Suillus spraguei]
MSPLSKAWSLIVVLAAAALVPRGVFAQTSDVACLSSYGWPPTDPCLVAAYLDSVCSGGDYSVNSLPSGDHYAPPTASEANNCQCSTVTYSLISACGDCQNATYLTWSSWSYNCTQIYLGVYPNNIPSGTAVPNWAYLNVTTNGFDPVAAQNDGDLPESTATKAQSTVSVPSSSTASATLTSSSGSPTASSTSSNNSKSSNAGAIAGGVVGGVVGAAIIIGLATWYFIKRRRSTTAPSAAFSDIGGGPGYSQSDPSDPSTFPGSPPSPTLLTTSSSNVYQNPSIPSHVFSQQSRPGQYSGTPEV